MKGEDYALGNVQLFSKAGDVAVETGAAVKTLGTGAEIDFVAGMAYGASGSVKVDGTVCADDAGEVYLHAGYGTAASGSATINGTVSAGGAVTVLAGNGYGAGGTVSIAGDVTAGGKATVGSYDGAVEMLGGRVKGGDGVAVSAFMGVAGTGELDASGKSLTVDGGIGDVALDGVVLKAKDATLAADDYAAYGNDYVGAVSAGNAANDFTGTVMARGSSVAINDANGLTVGDVKAYVGDVALTTAKGDLAVEGSVRAETAGAMIDIVAGADEGASGSLAVNGSVVADYSVQLATRSGDITVNGTVQSGADVLVDNESGKIVVGERGKLLATGESEKLKSDAVQGLGDMSHSVLIYGAMDASGSSDVEIEGEVTASGEKGYVFVRTGSDARQEGVPMAGGKGAVRISGAVNGTERVDIDTKDGDISIAAGGSVVTTGAKLALHAGMVAGGAGNVTVDGAVSADSADGAVEVMAGAELGNGKFTVGEQGRVTAAKDVYVASGSDIEVNGSMQSGDLITVVAEGGSLDVSKNGQLTAGRAVELWADGDIVASGDVLTTGSDTTLVAESKNGKIALAGRIVAGGADLNASSTVIANNIGNGLSYVTANGGSVAIVNSGNLTLGNVTATEGSADIQSVSGGIVLSGDVKATQDVSLMAKGNVVGENAVLAGGDLSVKSAGGNVALSGAVSARDVDVVAAQSALLLNEANTFSGTVTTKGQQVALFTCSDVRLGNVEATDGKVVVDAADGDIKIVGDVVAAKSVQATATSGSVIVDKGAAVRASGDGESVLLVSSFGDGTKGDVVVNGTVAADGENGRVDLMSGYGKGASGDVTIGATGIVRANAEEGQVYVSAGLRSENAVVGSGNVRIDGRIAADDHVLIHSADGTVTLAANANASASGGDGTVHLATGYAEGSKGDIDVAGQISAGSDVSVVSAIGAHSKGDVAVSGRVTAGNKALVMAGYSVNEATGAANSSGDAVVSGSVTAGKALIIGTGDGTVTLSGMASVTSADGGAYLAGGIYNGTRGDVRIDGTLASAGDAFVMTGVSYQTPGDIVFGEGGSVNADGNAFIVTSARGDVIQKGSAVPSADKGQVACVLLPAAVSAKTINFKVNGSIGNGETAPVAVKGKVFGCATGNASIAAAGGTMLQGGNNPGAVHTEYGSLDWANMDANSTIEAGGSLWIYAPLGISHYGNFLAGMDLTLSASSLGDLSYLRANGTLRVNNVGKPSSPLLAYFETENGVTPKIDNQPNDTVIFVDGRLAGGNIQTMNKLGSTEAFPVETPELKSVQGVFGTPTFLHGEVDLAEPVGIGVIDYLLVDRAKMSYGADIPPEMDLQVSVNGLSPRYSYWFGQRVAKGASESERKSNKGVVTIE